MKTDRTFSIYYNRRGSKQSPSVLKGTQMDKNDLVVGKVEPINNILRDIPSSYRISQDSFLRWLEDYKKSLNEKLDKAEKLKNDSLILMMTGKIVTCNDIELAYLKLK